MAEVLMYGGIDSSSTIDFINNVNLVDDGVLDVLVNTPGGSPEYGWGAVAKFQEFEGKKSIKNHGKAHSWGAFLNCYADDCSALDVTEFLIHRAAYDSWIEENYMDDAMTGNLMRINKSLETALRNKIDSAKFEALPQMDGKKIKDIFSMDDRIDIFLTSQDAKKVGLINKIIKITPEKKAQIDSKMFEIAAKYVAKPDANNNNLQTQNDKKMTFEEFKAKHPELFAQAVAIGEAQEKDRVGAWAKFMEVDSKAVAEGIESGKPLTQTAMADFSMKLFSKQALSTVEAEAARTTITTVVEEAAELTAAQKIEAKIAASTAKLIEDSKK